MKKKYDHTCSSKCGCEKDDKFNHNQNCEPYKKCEELACKSQDLYEQALCYQKKMERYLNLASQAECKAHELEEQVKVAWWEYNEFMENARNAADAGEELMKASCKFLQESQECYSYLNPSHRRNCNHKNQCDCGCDCDCDCDCGCNC